MSWLRAGVDVNFTNGFYESRSLQQSGQRCVNYYPNINQVPTLTPESLYMTHGITEIISGLDGVCRGSHTMNGVAYAVCGTKLYSIIQTVNPDQSIAWSANNLGSVLGSGRVVMSSGKTGDSYELIIVDPGVSSYHYDLATNSLSSLDGLSNFLTPAADVANVFGFFVFMQEGTNTLFHSNLRDGQTYGALDYFTITQVESLKGLVNFRDQLFVFGDYKLIPMSYVATATSFAFQLQTNSTKPYGLRSLHGKAEMGSRLVFIGNRRNAEPGIFVYSGGDPQKISSEVVDYKLQKMTVSQIDNAFILTWSKGGADFFGVIAADECFVYNFKSGRWHEQKSWMNSEERRWRVNSITQAYNVLLVGDFQAGLIGILDDVDSEYGVEMHRYITIQPYDAKGRYIQLKSLILVADNPGSYTLEISRDGVTWPDTPLERSSQEGEYGRVYQWDRLGSMAYLGVIRIGTSTGGHINALKALL